VVRVEWSVGGASRDFSLRCAHGAIPRLRVTIAGGFVFGCSLPWYILMECALFKVWDRQGGG